MSSAASKRLRSASPKINHRAVAQRRSTARGAIPNEHLAGMRFATPANRYSFTIRRSKCSRWSDLGVHDGPKRAPRVQWVSLSAQYDQAGLREIAERADLLGLRSELSNEERLHRD